MKIQHSRNVDVGGVDTKYEFDVKLRKLQGVAISD